MSQKKQTPPDTQATSKPQEEAKTTITTQQTETQTPSTTSSKVKTPKKTPALPPSAAANQKLYRELQREQKEMSQLKADMQRRLKEALKEHDRKLTQLARRCEPLEPGEAVQILMDLSDDDIAIVLKHMQPDKNVPIIELLKRNGRKIK